MCLSLWHMKHRLFQTCCSLSSLDKALTSVVAGSALSHELAEPSRYRAKLELIFGSSSNQLSSKFRAAERGSKLVELVINTITHPLSCFTVANRCIGWLWEGVENRGRAGAVRSVHFRYQFQVDSFHHQNSLLISYLRLSPPSPAFPPSHKRVIQPICYPPCITCHSLSPTHSSCAHCHHTFSPFLSHFFTNPPSMTPSSTLFTCLSLATVLRTSAWSVLHQFIPRCGPVHCQCAFKVLFLISSIIGTLYRPPAPCLPTCHL